MRHAPIHLSTNARLRSLATALRLRQVGVMHHGLDLVCDYADNMPRAWPDEEPIGRSAGEALPEPLRGTMISLKGEVLADRRARSVELEMAGKHARAILAITVSPDLDGDNVLAGLITTLTDVTDTRERERALTTLLRDVSHRSRNLLAIVQSISTQTGAKTGNLDDFLSRFRGRLQALAGTQDLVTDTDWRGAQLHDIVSGQLGHLSGRLPKSIDFKGDNPMLGPNAALHIGLALHELIENAVLHGALSRQPPGTVAIASSVDPASGNLTIDWQEAGTDVPLSQPAFGTAVLERIVPAAVAGTATYTLDPHRISYRLEVPSGEFEI